MTAPLHYLNVPAIVADGAADGDAPALAVEVLADASMATSQMGVPEKGVPIFF